MLAPGLGVSEDPATGSASGPLGCYLHKYGLLPRERLTDFVSLQGVKMLRPSRLHVSIEGLDAVTRVRVGGRSVLIGDRIADVLSGSTALHYRARLPTARRVFMVWSDMFVLGAPLLEKILRPLIVYAVLLLLIRMFGKRELAQLKSVHVRVRSRSPTRSKRSSAATIRSPALDQHDRPIGRQLDLDGCPYPHEQIDRSRDDRDSPRELTAR